MDADSHALYRRISDFAADQLMWRVLYINSELSGDPNAQALADKLISISWEAALIIVGSYSEPDAGVLAAILVRNNELFIEYVKKLKAGEDAGEIRQKWEQSNHELASLLNRTIPGQSNWQVMLDHECDLLCQVIADVSAGKFRTLTDLTPLISRLSADMSDYLTNGALQMDK